jgi:hypothetical protein
MMKPNRHKVQAFLFIMVGCNFQSVTLWTSTHGVHCYDQESVHCYKGMPCTSFHLIPHLPLTFYFLFVARFGDQLYRYMLTCMTV